MSLRLHLYQIWVLGLKIHKEMFKYIPLSTSRSLERLHWKDNTQLLSTMRTWHKKCTQHRYLNECCNGKRPIMNVQF